MRSNYRDEVNKILASLDDDNNQETEPETEIPATPSPEPLREIHFIFVREEEEDEQYYVDSVAEELDTTPLPTKPAVQPTSNVETGILPFGVFVILSCIISIMFQFYLIANPLTVTVTLAARSQQVSLQGTLQLGRVLNPITISQSATTQATGRGHQDAAQARGYITFYNGQLNSVFIPAGTILTGNSGEQIVTDADANIPAANLPQVGQATVSAHAVNAGSSGNISAYDINQGCCATAIKAVNQTSFSGGQDERNFQTVAKTDISNAAAPLQADLAASLQGALQGQLKQDEQLQRLPCSPTVTPDHHIGQEATNVKVTVSETCSGIAYNDQELTRKVTQLLNRQAETKLGAGYSILENPHITVTSATTAKQVMLSFTSVSTWIYALSSAEQKNIKKIIAGKTKEQAMQLLNSLPGIEGASLRLSGSGDDTKLPRDILHIHLLVIYTTA
jgi:hypothetical protein